MYGITKICVHVYRWQTFIGCHMLSLLKASCGSCSDTIPSISKKRCRKNNDSPWAQSFMVGGILIA